MAPFPRLTGTVTLVPLFTDASGSIAPLAAVGTTSHAWTWALLLVLVVLAGLLVAALAVRRRARRTAPRDPDGSGDRPDAADPRTKVDGHRAK